ncbi:oxygen-insensitive NAD(P)H-dependent nitroreductase NfsB [Salmonella enterica subsp. enterica serovar Choleraesuis]|nr:oxygen-insensitive NAD(P)H-dependent nitroreductase NfsB [Salmonella enterica subsp. enterica serovar Choleraesuis]
MQIEAILEMLLRQRFTAKAYDNSRKLTDEEKRVILDLLRFSPSSVNIQPWHFFVVENDEARARIMPAVMEGNVSKVTNASMTVVFAMPTELTEAHYQALLEREQEDGRYADDEARAREDGVRRFFTGLNSKTPEQQRAWMTRQVYISLGFLLLGVSTLGLDATPLEGFDNAKMDELLGLKEKGLTSVVMACIGQSSEDDFNAKLPKSRLEPEQVITIL